MAQILLIEPDRRMSDIYQASLRTAGHKVTSAGGAQAAIMAADKTKPDLVILELQLIEHSGIEFLYEFRSYPEWQAIPVLVLSQVPPSEFAASRQLMTDDLGVRTYLYKPRTSLRQLLANVSEQLSVIV